VITISTTTTRVDRHTFTTPHRCEGERCSSVLYVAVPLCLSCSKQARERDQSRAAA
jgi:hypothetical protein